jgi:hypothetical protein
VILFFFSFCDRFLLPLMQMHLFIKVSRLTDTLIWCWNRLKPLDSATWVFGQRRVENGLFLPHLPPLTSAQLRRRRLENNTHTTAFEIIWSSTLDALLSNHYKHLMSGVNHLKKSSHFTDLHTIIMWRCGADKKRLWKFWYADSDMAQISHSSCRC